MNYSNNTIASLAFLIDQDWSNTPSKVYAQPYIHAMMSLRSVEDTYGLDSGASVVSYFLANAGAWRGKTARKIKAELKQRLQTPLTAW